MLPDPKNILRHILTILSFDEDKEAYIDEFIDMCQKQTLGAVLKKLPQEKQEEIKTKTMQGQKIDFSAYISTDTYNRELKETSQRVFVDFLEKLTPYLNETQKEQLDSYLSSLSEQYPIR